MRTDDSNQSHTRADERLLGEVATRIVGMQYYEAANPLPPGGQVNLERETGNRHDRRAIRVENAHFEPVGHVPRDVSRWMTPLIDAGKIRVDGCVPAEAPDSGPEPNTAPLLLSIFLCPKGQAMLDPARPATKQQALHEVVRRTYQQVQGYDNPRLIAELADGLKPLARQNLLPETRLLLALMPGLAREVRTNNGVESMAAMRSLLTRLTIGEPVHHHNLTLFPLTWPEDRTPPYALLGDAIDRGEVTVEEVSDSGEVPRLRLVNRGVKPVLVVQGEILIGAKQNRVANATVLVPAETTFPLPVSCVEQGRWNHVSPAMQARFCAPPSLRSRTIRSVGARRAATGESDSDQGAVWGEVAAAMEDVGAASPTGSLTDGLEATDADARQYRDKLDLPEGTAGVLAARGDWVVGLDLFDSPETMRTYRDRLLGAYVFDALRDRTASPRATRELAESFLDRVGSHARPRLPALGLGRELEMVEDHLVGTALLYDDGLCHLAAFSSPV